jgi:hypothetical protein
VADKPGIKEGKNSCLSAFRKMSTATSQMEAFEEGNRLPDSRCRAWFAVLLVSVAITAWLGGVSKNGQSIPEVGVHMSVIQVILKRGLVITLHHGCTLVSQGWNTK